ncbi:MAG: recombination helicase AddA [Limisphaerales bacterium]|nr:MAG: recombination helicase AddA [Limisphaerales bacterium]KAG0510171.1 MAG: recombination helicase AddA [Limisphaerales bacterium]
MSNFTPAQQSAIAARGDVLVVAGAGTGKTRTLVARVLQLLQEGASLDQFLLVTFTEAAAAEMRARLRKALQNEFEQASAPVADRLAEQLALLDTAQISTLHSFCLRLVREHFHHLAIDPQLVILDERQTRPLGRDTLTALLAEHYAGRHPHSETVQQLIRRAGRGSDEHLRALVWKLHCYAQSLPDPDAWFAAQLAAFREQAPTQWQDWLLTALNEWRVEWLPALAAAPDVPALKQCEAALRRSAAVQAASATSKQNAQVGHLRSTAETLTAILAADSTENWKRKKGELRPPFAKLFEEAEFFHGLLAPVPRAGDSQSPSEASEGKNGPAQATSSDGDCKSPARPLAEDWEWCRHEMAALVQLTQQFTTRFGEAKRQLGGVDFADLEQFALRLLRDDATGVARRCRAQFAHVCVDEYQDINAAQDAILRLVSCDGADANRFLVGDLKQSIYRFRLANPHIFAGYAKAWRRPGSSRRAEAPASQSAIGNRQSAIEPSLLTSAATGSVLALSDNFRSREAILNFVNPLFRALMRESVGGVICDAEAELKFGNADADATERRLEVAGTSRVELHILTKDADEQPDDRDAATDLLDLPAIEREARCVALRLRELRASLHEVWDEDAASLRPVEWRDMVVLMRSPGSRVEAFAQEFHRAGVPLHAERGGFYEALEVSDLLNLLRLLDNPLQDLPLLAVLRSPLVAMSLEELVAIRAHNEERMFWDALIRFCADGARTPTSAASCAGDLQSPSGVPGQFESRFDSDAADGGCKPPARPTARSAFRTPPSAFEKASAFLTRFATWRDRLRLSSLTDCLERVLAETHYESLLLAEPRGAERVANVRRLLDLARQFDPYQRQGLHRFLQFIAAQAEAELDHDPAPAPTDNAVRLMSIHQSKGLEFPVVVVAGLGTLFNERDLRGDILLDEEFSLCPMVSPPGRERRYASLPHWLARRRGRRELLGEELRLLYVALTRARDTLLLVGTDAGKDVAAKWRGPAEPLADAALLKARCPLNWLRAWLPGVVNEADWRNEAAGQSELLSWDFYTADDERLAGSSRREEAPSQIQGEEGASSPRRPPEEVARLRTKLDWCYQHADATHEPAKTSVTILRRRAAEADEEATQWFRPRTGGPRRKRGELSAAQLGVAHHTFLQCVDLARTATALDLRNEAARLVAAGFLTERDAAALDFAALLRFWESPAGQQVRANASRVQREVPFTARFTVRELEAMGLIQTETGSSRREEAPSECGTRNAERGTENQRLLTSSPTEDEFVIVQGVADLVVFGEREIWLLDYKTDHFDEAELPAKVREYGPQLSLYAEALERIYGKKVTRTWLHFLALGRTENL